MYSVFTVSSTKFEKAYGPGRYFRIMSAVSASLRCRFVFDDDIIETEIPAGVGIPFPQAFKHVEIWGYGAEEEVTVMVHSMVVHDDRLNVSGPLTIAGVVTVDAVPATTYNRYGWAIQISSAAANYCYAELHNPVGSGVTLIVDSIEMRRDTGRLAFFKLPLPSSPTPTAVTATATVGSGVSKGKIKTAVDRPSSYVTEYGGSFGYAAFAEDLFPVADALVLDKQVYLEEGASLVAVPYAAQVKMQGFIGWEERANV